jgi:hypothetical protein
VPLDPVPAPLRPLVTAGMAKDPEHRPADATAFVAELRNVAPAAYGQDWEKRGRSQLGEAALLLAALWPSGAPPAAQGTAVHQVRLFRHVTPVKAAIAAGIAVAAVAAGTALAANQSHGSHIPNRQAAVVHPVSLQPSTSTSTTASSSSLASSTPTVSGPATTSGPSVNTSPQVTSSPSVSASPHVVSGPPVSPTSVSPSPVLTSKPRPPAVPQISSVSTYTSGVFVYFSIQYTDPGHNAGGFGFVGVNGSGWAQEEHPFSSPSYGIVGPNSIAYPFNLGCSLQPGLRDGPPAVAEFRGSVDLRHGRRAQPA